MLALKAADNRQPRELALTQTPSRTTPPPSAFFSQVLRMDLEHEQHRGVRPSPGPSGPDPAPENDPESRADSFRRLYDAFLFLALAFTVLEALMLRLGRRRLAAAAVRRRASMGDGGFLTTGALESLLDEEDLRQAGWEDWPGDSVQQVRCVSVW